VVQEVIVSGSGGQGIQLLCKALALGATRQGRYAMLAAEYGGEMRGGPSQASVVISDEPLRALPILPSTGSAILMHHRFSEHALQRLRPDGLLVLNSSIVPGDFGGHPGRVVSVAATTLAQELGAPQAAGFVMLGAYVTISGTGTAEAIDSAMRELLPPYRAQHADSNSRAIRLGVDTARELMSVTG
jgi:2-oxoglutarate ferredoxin oxidoreductase subunit gamma